MHLFSAISDSYKKISNGIAFLPSIISLGIVVLAFLLIFLQHTGIGMDVLTGLNFVQFQEAATVRALLSAMLSGTISLTVFSFSMVMVVVNQAASNYSPKVIEGFIHETTNQVILGVYIGTILFIIISLTQVGDPENFGEVPHFNVFASILLIAICIGLFILFIQNISNSVRINNVAERIYNKTRRAMENHSETNYECLYPQGEEWHEYTAETNGYFQRITSQSLLNLLEKENLKLKVIPVYSTYILPRRQLFCLNRKVEDEKLLNKLRQHFNIYSGENVSDNYFYGFRQLREVAVKALSPGINDPGIAIICLDYLSELLIRYKENEKRIGFKDSCGEFRIYFRRHSFEAMLNLTLTPIEGYGKNDYLVLAQLLMVLGNIALFDPGREQRDSLNLHAESVLRKVKEHIDGVEELKYINQVIDELCASGYFNMQKVEI